MNAEELRATQTPLKAKYKETPSAARFTLRAAGRVDVGGQTCSVEAGHGPTVVAGLHPAAGGGPSGACSGDMLLESLVACAGVTLGAVATAMGITLRDALVTAEGDLDFRGTLGVSKEVPIGFSEVRLRFDLDTDAPDDQVANLVRLTERYCVIFQTLKTPPALSASVARGSVATA